MTKPAIIGSRQIIIDSQSSNLVNSRLDTCVLCRKSMLILYGSSYLIHCRYSLQLNVTRDTYKRVIAFALVLIGNLYNIPGGI